MILSLPIVLFCGRLLPASETFICLQGESLTQFTPYYMGTRMVKGVHLPLERTQAVNQGGILGAATEVAFKIWGRAPQLSQYLTQLRPSLIHAHFGVCGALVLPIATALRLPLIVTFHGLDATMSDHYARRHSISTWVYLRRREVLKQKTQLFICVSEFIKTKLLAQGFPAHKVLVHYIGIDTDVFCPDPSIAREPVVLFVGRLVEKKGCEYLIRAMSQVNLVLPETKLVIIGDGPLRPELETLAAHNLNHYEFLGVQPAAIVRDWMRQSSLLVVPSITSTTGDSEGLPMVVVEAQATGLPVVASRHGGIPEAISHGETGLLVSERDWQDLAQHIQYLFQNPVSWQEISEKGRQQTLNKFNLHKQTQVLEAIYHTVLKQRY